MKAKATFYFLILCPQLLSLERYRRKKGVEVKVHCRAFYGKHDGLFSSVITNAFYSQRPVKCGPVLLAAAAKSRLSRDRGSRDKLSRYLEGLPEKG
jgi:hypothetical protein